ncbi:MAG TPA: hypothetical protein VFC25_12235 [Verrucomicrobiae bacterium]|nr:hypothetical protein [Verrucomicrobiae bacterium]
MDTSNTTTGSKGSSGKEMSTKKMGMTMTKTPSRNEDLVTSTIEQTTAKVPSVAFLSVAIGAIAGSLGFFLAGKKHAALLMATWVPTILILGNYNKLVKAIGHVPGGTEGGSYGASNQF